MAGELIQATVLGFSRKNCKKCHGLGRLGYDTKYKDNSHVIPCTCVEFFELVAVQRSIEAEKAKANGEAQRRDGQIGEGEGHLPSRPSTGNGSAEGRVELSEV